MPLGIDLDFCKEVGFVPAYTTRKRVVLTTPTGEDRAASCDARYAPWVTGVCIGPRSTWADLKEHTIVATAIRPKNEGIKHTAQRSEEAHRLTEFF